MSTTLLPITSNPFNVTSAGWILTADLYVHSASDGEYGFDSDVPVGSISPTTFNGVTIKLLATAYPSYVTGFSLAGEYSQSFFTSISINGTTLLSASAMYNINVTTHSTLWVWPGSNIIISSGTYQIEIT